MGLYNNVENGLLRIRRAMIIQLCLLPFLLLTVPIFVVRLIIGSAMLSFYIFKLIGMGFVARDIKVCYIALFIEIIARGIEIVSIANISVIEQIYNTAGPYINMMPMLIIMLSISKELKTLGWIYEAKGCMYYAFGYAVLTIARYVVPNILISDESLVFVSLIVLVLEVVILVIQFKFLKYGIENLRSF